jgi:hypothetical protein
VADLAEGFGRCGADLFAGAVGAPQFGEARLDRGVAAPERVVFGVELRCESAEIVGASAW